jgi:hypothetical protein
MHVCALLLTAACAAEPQAPLRVEAVALGDDTRLTLISAPQLKLSARIRPALELADGRVLRFDSPDLTADSAYFASPPTVTLPGRHGRVRGTVRASVCENDAPVCRSLELQL